MLHQWQIQGMGPPLFLDQTEGRKNILGRPDPRPALLI